MQQDKIGPRGNHVCNVRAPPFVCALYVFFLSKIVADKRRDSLPSSPLYYLHWSSRMGVEFFPVPSSSRVVRKIFLASDMGLQRSHRWREIKRVRESYEDIKRTAACIIGSGAVVQIFIALKLQWEGFREHQIVKGKFSLFRKQCNVDYLTVFW